MYYLPVIIVLLIAAAVIVIWSQFTVSVSRFDIETEKNADLKIVQVSDLHNQLFGMNQEYLFKKIEKENPDFIVITGDSVEKDETENAELLFCRLLEKWKGKTVLITGNHETYGKESSNAFLSSMKKKGLIVLEDSSFTKENTVFYGLGGEGKEYSQERISSLFEKSDPEKLNILLMHEPQYLNVFDFKNTDIIFSGHAHGGQIYFPVLNIGTYAPGQGLFPKLVAGIHTNRTGTKMVISRGLGQKLKLPRIFNRPNLVSVRIHSVTEK